MLTHPSLDLLHSLGLLGKAKGFKDLDAQPDARSLEHAEWLPLLLEHEKTIPTKAVRKQSSNRQDTSYRLRQGCRVPRYPRLRPRAVSKTRRRRLDPGTTISSLPGLSPLHNAHLSISL